MTYERSGERSRATGRDLWVFARQDGEWLAAWRMTARTSPSNPPDANRVQVAMTDLLVKPDSGDIIPNRAALPWVQIRRRRGSSADSGRASACASPPSGRLVCSSAGWIFLQLALNHPRSRRGRHIPRGVLSRLNQSRVAKCLKLDPPLARRPLAISALGLGTIKLADRDIFWYFLDHEALEALPEAGSGVRSRKSALTCELPSIRQNGKCIQPPICTWILIPPSIG